MCKSCLTIVKDYSQHNITFCANTDINNFDLDDYDILHVHQQIHDKFLNSDIKTIYNIHNFVLSCPMGGNICLILNKFLHNPLTCSDCLGYVGMKTGGDNLKKYIRFAQNVDTIAVHSDYMREYYHNYNPVVLPLPLETNIEPTENKEEYLFYTGRLSFEKNPYGFVDIINKTGLRGKMVLYTLASDISNSKKYYQDLFKLIKNNKNIELYLDPSLNVMFELIRHAKFTVLPYFFTEPFGIAAANSVLCGTPLVTFPYGNLRNMTSVLPKTQEEMIQILKMNDKQYTYILEETLKKRDELKQVHNPKNAIEIWDNIYEHLYQKTS